MNMAASLEDFFLTTTFSTSQSELLSASVEAFEAAEEMLCTLDLLFRFSPLSASLIAFLN